MTKVMITNSDGEPLGFEYVYDDAPEPPEDYEAPMHGASWMAEPHTCGATHDPDKVDCDDALELQAIDESMLRNAY